MFLEDKKFLSRYADSLLTTALKSNDKETIGTAYLTKGIVHYDKKELKKALDNYISADKFMVNSKDHYTIYKIKYSIAHTKDYLGFYDEAISLFRECIDYFKEENDRAYLTSLHSLALCYNHIGKYAWCTITNQTGIDEGIRLEDRGIENYFNHSEGVNLNSLKKYRESIAMLSSTVAEIKKKEDFANESIAYFYIGDSYWNLNEKDTAVLYFKKVDAIYDQQNYIRPDLRKAYEKLIEFYSQKNDSNLELHYINKLLKIDEVIAQDYRYLFKKIVKEYDTKELLDAKQEIENKMKFQSIMAFIIIATMGIIIVLLIKRHLKNKRIFRELMRRNPLGINNLSNQSKNGPVNAECELQISDKNTQHEISEELEIAIVKRLEKLEQTKRYLEKDMNLAKLALILNTNTKYVTLVIAKYRGKGTIEYITDLKINYIIQLLKTESKYRKYTNKALSEEAGFGSSQNFAKAFKSRTDIAPTFFISQLEK